ncbi:MAG TPA: phage/plasmid primase, P4 family [Nitrososphaeraceae archaeon]|nr:phage/plasmid primase, P4 family [Nitrososphaeraceae archaeon]
MTFNSDNIFSGKKLEHDKIIESINYLTNQYNFATLKDTDEIYYYDSNRGIYVKGREVFIKSELAAMQTYMPIHQVNEIINTIKSKTYTDRKEFDSKIEWLACKDCMINLLNGETQSHSPDFMATLQIPVTYKKIPDLPNNQFLCPKIMKFLHEIVSDKRDVETIIDFMAYCLWREMKFHKLLLLNGEGGNGKGTLCKLITCFFGRENVSSESLDQLLNGRFSPSQINGKLVNIDADTSKEISKKLGILKKLTGNDLISAEEKFKSPFNFVNHAKLIQVTNKLPEIKEDTIAIFSRLLIIDFSKTFIKNANPDLIKELTTEEELSGLLHVLLKRLPRVLKSGISYSKPIETLEQYQLRMNSVKYFSDNYLEKVQEYKVKKEVVYKKYKEFCFKNKITPKAEYKFSQQLVRMGFEYKQLRDGGTYRPYYWINLRMKEK